MGGQRIYNLIVLLQKSKELALAAQRAAQDLQVPGSSEASTKAVQASTGP